VRSTGAFEAVVARKDFEAARSIFEMRAKRLSDDEMISLLAALLQERGGLSAVIIDEASGVPSSATYRKRFGTLSRAYRLVGASGRDDEYVEIIRTSWSASSETSADWAGPQCAAVATAGCWSTAN
jgi:hypothetical protein